MSLGKILIVDDNPINLKLIKVLLSIDDYDLKTAADAYEAIEILNAFHPKVILMDIQLPGMDGLELTKKLKADANTSDIIILALTAYAMKGDDEKIMSAGCDGYITKPIDTTTLPQLIKDYMTK